MKGREMPAVGVAGGLGDTLETLQAGQRLALRVGGFALALCALFLLADLSSFPIALWDESRVAVNAIEMYLSGPGLVTTYEFQPDLWNTKPPLLVWLMVASMRLFGPSDWALRLPSALAAVGTLAIVMSFSWRLTHSITTALLACVLLVTSRGFYGQHAAATADYDALLTFCTTAYLCVLFFTLHRRRPSFIKVLGAGALIAAAVMAKGIAGLIPGVGILIYILIMRRWTRPFASPWYAVAGLAAAIVVAGFFTLREAAAPGYIAAVMRNDLGGRYLETIGGHDASRWYYIADILKFRFIAGAFVFLAPLAIMVARKREQLGILYAASISVGVIAAYSFGATKLAWYIVPAYPFMAIVLALAVHAWIRWASKTLSQRNAGLHDTVKARGRLAILALSMPLILGAVVHRYWWSTRSMSEGQANYGVLFSNLYRQGIRHATVADGGDSNTEGLVHYSPRLRYYSLMWGLKGLTIDVVPDLTTSSEGSGGLAVTCDPKYVSAHPPPGVTIDGISSCMRVRLSLQTVPTHPPT